LVGVTNGKFRKVMVEGATVGWWAEWPSPSSVVEEAMTHVGVESSPVMESSPRREGWYSGKKEEDEEHCWL
jgi:hypothetical protein